MSNMNVRGVVEVPQKLEVGEDSLEILDCFCYKWRELVSFSSIPLEESVKV